MAPSRLHIVRIGVTGGIGSGKSEVCRLFGQRGIPVLSADDVAKELSETTTDLRRSIARLLGAEAYLPNGSFNRRYVASRIFPEKKLRAALNAIVHPAVLKELNRRIRLLEKQGQSIVIVEAALIYEAEYDKELDAVLVVDANENVRIRRVVERDGVSESEVRQRMTAQWPAAKKLRNADYVIWNNGSMSELKEKVDFLCSIFHHLSRKGKP